MILVGSGIRYAAAAGWGMLLMVVGAVILILYMGLDQERWATRERHRLIESALKRSGALSGYAPAKPGNRRGTRARGGGKPMETGSSGRAQDAPPRLGAGGVPPDPSPAPEREGVGEEGRAGGAGAEQEKPPEGTDTGNGS